MALAAGAVGTRGRVTRPSLESSPPDLKMIVPSPSPLITGNGRA
jgi:hypothetical protein